MIRYYIGTLAIAFAILFTLTTGCKDDEPLTENTEFTSDTTWTDTVTVPIDTIVIDNTTGDTTTTDIQGCTDPNASNYNSEATTDDGSCEYIETITGDIGDLLSKLQPDTDKETHDLDADIGGTIQTNVGTNYIFEGGSFVTMDNQPVTGPIQIEILELYSKGDIVKYGRQTISNGQILRSDGEFLVKAYQNGQELQIAPGESYKIQVQNENPDPAMLLFEGDDSGDTFNWLTFDLELPNPSWGGVNSLWPSEWEDSLSSEGFGFGYEIFSDRFDWLNCDAFANYPPEDLTEISVTLPEQYDNSNTVVFIVFNDENTILSMWGDPDTESFVSWQVPIDTDITIVVMSSTGEAGVEEYQLDLISTTITDGLVIEGEPEDATIEEIENALDGLL